MIMELSGVWNTSTYKPLTNCLLPFSAGVMELYQRYERPFHEGFRLPLQRRLKCLPLTTTIV